MEVLKELESLLLHVEGMFVKCKKDSYSIGTSMVKLVQVNSCKV